MLNVIYSLEEIGEPESLIFLAGPTHRVVDGVVPPISWREQAVYFLEAHNYSESVCYPEWRNNIKPEGWAYKKQVDWEEEGLEKAGVILFWIPRNVRTLPGFTTNVEFGEWMKSGKIVVGVPDSADSVRYIREKCRRNGISCPNTLEACVSNAIFKLETLRHG